MADHKDESVGDLALSISMIYTILVNLCGKLPVPIGLPIDQDVPGPATTPAIQRVAEVAEDQPMGDTQVEQLYLGCIYLLAAIDLYEICTVRFTMTRVEGAAANLLLAEGELNTLTLWLAVNEAD
ncbi:hypothetical protein [Streptomyces sp. NPDC051572]|jgi:hypothetical protein|uniref:hypothetical protein n=1 Tax=Streptomyces sp. NPDC051572 TaxID=3155802 RepID=UPI00344B97D8